MIKLNDSDIFVGHIKQVLKNFNLPNFSLRPSDKDKELDKHYLENNTIYLCKDLDRDKDTPKYDHNFISIDCGPYIYGHYYPDLTSNLKIENNLYDRYTHRYLGKYLRFLRDYNKLDLMCMYNLFDQEINDKQLSFNTSIRASYTYEQLKQQSSAPKFLENTYYKKLEDNTYSLLETEPSDWSTNYTNYYQKIIKEDIAKHIFNEVDSDFSAYSIPILPNEIYTLALQSHVPIEMCITIHNYKESSEKDYTLYNLARYTFKKKKINQVILLDDLFEGLQGEEWEKELLRLKIIAYKENLRLLIKVPTELAGSIILLEGDYVTSGENVKDESQFLKIKSQLLDYTNNKSYLLSDRLTEYLTENAISPISKDYDITKVQKYLVLHDMVSYDYYGLWSDNDTNAIKKYIKEKNLNKVKFDMLGYCDKDIENLFQLQDETGITEVE